MVARLSVWAWCLLSAQVLALPQPQHVPRDDASAPAWNSCGNLIREVTASQYGVVNASHVYDCWATVPFNAAVGTRFIKYLSDSLEFQSSLDYLKKPPKSYQKPAVDLLAGLRGIQATIDANGYSGQYEFEAAVQRLIFSANDDHVSLSAGVLSSFSFANPWGLTSLSLDGVAVPKVYLTYDLYINQTKGPGETWQPSAITQFNGQDIVEYLSEFAALNSGGTLEPNADWNTLMDSPVFDVLLDYTTWSGDTTFYPGDTFTYTFENGSMFTDAWLGLYNDPGDTGPLETGGDFYNFFVLGFYPASYNPNDTSTNFDEGANFTLPVVTSYSDYTIAYPDQPDVYQANLTDTGYVTGYFYPASSLAVLSIPTFDMSDEAIQAFSDAVQRFVDGAKAKGLQKVVIDLQKNFGGDVLLAYNTFKQFFPSIEPYGGSKRRSFPLANTFGNTITNYWDSLQPSDEDYLAGLSDEWVATFLTNAQTGQNFTSWAQLYGPILDGVGNFSEIQRLNTHEYLFDYANYGNVNPPAPIFQGSGASPWSANNIVILSDAICSSACALFLEMMRHDAGVKNVVVGGRPSTGPMQTPSLSRAARFYSLFEMDSDFANVVAIDPAAVVPDRSDSTMFIAGGGVSIREQVKPKDTVPLEMQYEAADCRIYFTPDTFSNFTNLWQYAADAIWTNPSRCVPGSTGFATSGTGSGSFPSQSVPAGVTYDSNGILTNGNNSSTHISLLVNHDGPMPDAPIAGAKLRTHHNTNSESTSSNLANTNTNTNSKPSKQQEADHEDDTCVLVSSSHPSPICSHKRRKRSLLKRRSIR